MFDFSEILQPHLDRMRPMAQSAAEEARAWGERVLCRLDRIGDAVEGDGVRYWRERPTFTLAPGARETIIVPAGESWQLEVITMVPTDAAAVPGSVTLGVGTGLPMFGANHNGRACTSPGWSTRFESGTQVSVDVSEAAVIVSFQFKVERRETTRRGVGGTREIPAEPGITPPNGEIGRHHGNWATVK